MKIAIVGTGGVGGYFGGLLAKAGSDVTFLARGDHLRAIREHGLQVRSVHGDFHIHPARAEQDPAEVGPVDYVVVAVKTYHLEAAAKTLAPLVGASTTVVPLLNGVEAGEILKRHLPSQAVVGGLCALVTYIEAPGVIRQESQQRRLVVGEWQGGPSERLSWLVDAWKAHGVDAALSPDIEAALWTKFLFIASMGGITALARATIGAVRSDEETRTLLRLAFREVEAVARARGVRLAVDVVQTTMDFVDGLEHTATTSMQRDVVAGRPFELEAFSGKVVKLGREAPLPTPIHAAMYALLRPQLAGAVGGRA
jgi:2-dehydropantoate 2-reductase